MCQTGVLDMSVTDGGVASIAPYVAGGSELVFKTNASGSGVLKDFASLHRVQLQNQTTHHLEQRDCR